MVKLLFCDLDGTIRQTISGKTFINDPHDQQLIEGVAEALKYYLENGWTIIGISNQGGVASGHKSLESAIAEQQYTLSLTPQLEKIYFCPNFDGEDCWVVDRKTYYLVQENYSGEFGGFRKPSPGMLNLAIKFYQPSEVVMVGDRSEDREAAEAANVLFVPADVWRGRFLKGLQEFGNLTIEQIQFLENLKL
jgi:D-glycero-D-manno-heptose 1,7-bisphosphate phosphatase